MTMNSGTYWIGDLCYVLKDNWNEVCDIVIDGGSCLEGEFKLSNGVAFAMYNTKYGDGEYYDDSNLSYPVDSGSLGCVLLEHVDGDCQLSLGRIVEFQESFRTGNDANGTIFFGEGSGSVRIYTGEE